MKTLYFGSTGLNVKLIQSPLHKIGYNAGVVDGIFGAATYAAIQAFQTDYGLVPDAKAARKRADSLAEEYEKRFPETIQILEDGLEDSLQFYVFPA